MATCKFCANDSGDQEVCTTCRAKLGLSDGDGVRRTLPCQRCNHPELIRALAREIATEVSDWSTNRVVPMAVTIVPPAKHTFWAGKRDGIDDIDPTKGMGILEMYICRKCGFTEWYCRDPKNVPIGEEYGTELVQVEGDKPYR